MVGLEGPQGERNRPLPKITATRVWVLNKGLGTQRIPQSSLEVSCQLTLARTVRWGRKRLSLQPNLIRKKDFLLAAASLNLCFLWACGRPLCQTRRMEGEGRWQTDLRTGFCVRLLAAGCLCLR